MITRVAETNRLKFVEASPGVQLNYLDQGTSHPFVFLPGWPFSNEIFEFMISTLTDKGYRVVIPSLRGFGTSDKVIGAYNYDLQADDLKGLLEKLELTHVILVGHSMGASVAIRYMSKHLGARVDKLVLCGAAAPVWSRRTGFTSGLSLTAADELIEGLQADRSKVIQEMIRVFKFSDTSLSPSQGEWLQNLAMQSSSYVMNQTLVEMRNGDLRPDLERIKVPTAIFHGVSDRFCPFPFAGELAKAIKFSKVVKFDRSGHLPFLEEADKFKLELLKFAATNI